MHRNSSKNTGALCIAFQFVLQHHSLSERRRNIFKMLINVNEAEKKWIRAFEGIRLISHSTFNTILMFLINRWSKEKNTKKVSTKIMRS